MSPLRRTAPLYPALLQDALSHTHRFTRTLRALEEDVKIDDDSVRWFVGRAGEVRVFTLDVLRAWSSGELSAEAAARALNGYLQELHASLEQWYGRWYAPSCCGPLSGVRQSGVRARHERADHPPRRVDSLADTVSGMSLRSVG